MCVMGDFRLIEVVKHHKCLYDAKNQHYKDMIIRENVWTEISVFVLWIRCIVFGRIFIYLFIFFRPFFILFSWIFGEIHVFFFFFFVVVGGGGGGEFLFFFVCVCVCFG